MAKEFFYDFHSCKTDTKYIVHSGVGRTKMTLSVDSQTLVSYFCFADIPFRLLLNSNVFLLFSQSKSGRI